MKIIKMRVQHQWWKFWTKEKHYFTIVVETREGNIVTRGWYDNQEECLRNFRLTRAAVRDSANPQEFMDKLENLS